VTVKELQLSHLKRILNAFTRIKLAKRKVKARRLQSPLLFCTDEGIRQAY